VRAVQVVNQEALVDQLLCQLMAQQWAPQQVVAGALVIRIMVAKYTLGPLALVVAVVLAVLMALVPARALMPVDRQVAMVSSASVGVL
jgi:hypothetical protein